jgi:hypothetical protein
LKKSDLIRGSLGYGNQTAALISAGFVLNKRHLTLTEEPWRNIKIEPTSTAQRIFLKLVLKFGSFHSTRKKKLKVKEWLLANGFTFKASEKSNF